MTREDYVKHLINAQGFTIKSFASEIDMPYSTLLSMLNGSLGAAAIDNVIKICKGLNITIDELQSRGISEETISLSDKEKRIIIAYRNQPAMQKAVDRVLAISEEAVEYIPSLVAARSQGNNIPIQVDNVPDLSKIEPDDTDL